MKQNQAPGPLTHPHCGSQAATYLCLHLLPDFAVLLGLLLLVFCFILFKRCPHAISFLTRSWGSCREKQSEEAETPTLTPVSVIGLQPHSHLSCRPVTRLRSARTVGSRGLRGGGRRFGRRGSSGGTLRVGAGVGHQLGHRPAPIDVLKFLYLRVAGSGRDGSAIGTEGVGRGRDRSAAGTKTGRGWQGRVSCRYWPHRKLSHQSESRTRGCQAAWGWGLGDQLDSE